MMQILTREEARTQGLKRYSTGEPCKHGHKADRLVSNRSCIKCGSKRAMAWASNHAEKLNKRKRMSRTEYPEKVRGYERARYQTDPRQKMLSAAKQRAAKRGVRFELTLDDIVIPAACPLLGILITIGDGVMNDNSPSLDRIRNEAGYIPGNVIVVSHLANRCKGSLRADDLIKLANNLKALEDKGFI